MSLLLASVTINLVSVLIVLGIIALLVWIFTRVFR